MARNRYDGLSHLDKAKAKAQAAQNEQRRLVEQFVAVVKATKGEPRDLGPNVVDLIPYRVRREG
jgi:hypothetical protein